MKTINIQINMDDKFEIQDVIVDGEKIGRNPSGFGGPDAYIWTIFDENYRYIQLLEGW